MAVSHDWSEGIAVWFDATGKILENSDIFTARA
jgi:hypothetical protein